MRMDPMLELPISFFRRNRVHYSALPLTICLRAIRLHFTVVIKATCVDSYDELASNKHPRIRSVIGVFRCRWELLLKKEPSGIFRGCYSKVRFLL